MMGLLKWLRLICGLINYVDKIHDNFVNNKITNSINK